MPGDRKHTYNGCQFNVHDCTRAPTLLCAGFELGGESFLRGSGKNLSTTACMRTSRTCRTVEPNGVFSIIEVMNLSNERLQHWRTVIVGKDLVSPRFIESDTKAVLEIVALSAETELVSFGLLAMAVDDEA